MTEPIPLDRLIPGGIQPSDYCHHSRHDRTCSRCRNPIAAWEAPLMLWGEDGDSLWMFCGGCQHPEGGRS